MSDAIESLHIINNNPFIFASSLLNFYKNLGSKPHSLLLAYLVFPISLPENRRRYLKSARPASNLRTMVLNKELVGGLQELVADYKEVTNATLQYLISAGCIEFLGDVINVSGNLVEFDVPEPKGLEKATTSLARFFLPYDVPTIYRMVGVLEL